MSTFTTSAATHPAGLGPDVQPATVPDLAADRHEGWQALAVASLGRPFTATELTAAEHLPTEVALDLFFPHLGEAARHEALSTLS